MSHAIRNTLILVIVFILFAGLGWGYIYYYQKPEIEKLQEQVDNKHTELQQNQQIASQFEAISETYQEASQYFNNYEKALYTSSNEDNVYDFLNSLNAGESFNNFNFTFTDSVIHNNYGILNMQISGDGAYRNVVNFVRQVELSKPLNKVKNVTITPAETEGEFNRVEYTFYLESYYDRSKILEDPSLNISSNVYASVYNPFFPLIRSVFKPNTAGFVDISKSRLVALSTDRVFIVDQNGVMQQVKVGEEVYLGRLSSINLNTKTATFTLNKGGIVKRETLEVNNEKN